MDPIDAINDGLRQSVHADEIRRRREGQQPSPSDGNMMADLLRRITALEGWRSNLKGRNGIRVEDGEIVFQGKQQTANSEGEWYSLTLCDGTTLEVSARNIVPP